MKLQTVGMNFMRRRTGLLIRGRVNRIVDWDGGVGFRYVAVAGVGMFFFSDQNFPCGRNGLLGCYSYSGSDYPFSNLVFSDQNLRMSLRWMHPSGRRYIRWQRKSSMQKPCPRCTLPNGLETSTLHRCMQRCCLIWLGETSVFFLLWTLLVKGV